jgi:hypothetical protein
MWTGGVFGFSGGSGGSDHTDIESITLTLDGVFFTDGAFAGLNTHELFEQVAASADAHQQVLAIAEEGGAATHLRTFWLKSRLWPLPPSDRQALVRRVESAAKTNIASGRCNISVSEFRGNSCTRVTSRRCR